MPLEIASFLAAVVSSAVRVSRTLASPPLLFRNLRLHLTVYLVNKVRPSSAYVEEGWQPRARHVIRVSSQEGEIAYTTACAAPIFLLSLVL